MSARSAVSRCLHNCRTLACLLILCALLGGLQSIYIHFQGETTLAIASAAGIKVSILPALNRSDARILMHATQQLCDRTGRRVLFTLTLQQLNRMIGRES
jgi:hypothetical protein